MSILDDLQPIGSRTSEPTSGAEEQQERAAEQPAALRRLSEHERQRRSARTLRDRAGRGEISHIGKQKRRRSSRTLSASELLVMSSELARFYHGAALDPDAKSHESKHYGVGFSCMVDKINTLEGRPTQIHAFADLEARSGVIELASRIASSARQERSA